MLLMLWGKDKQKKIGNHGDYICFSFQAIKHITSGDGGLLVCKNKSDAKSKIVEMVWMQKG